MASLITENTHKFGCAIRELILSRNISQIMPLMTDENFVTYHFWFKPTTNEGVAIYQVEDGRFIHVSSVSKEYIETDRDYRKENYIGSFKSRFSCTLRAESITKLKEKGLRNLIDYTSSPKKEYSLFINDFPDIINT